MYEDEVSARLFNLSLIVVTGHLLHFVYVFAHNEYVSIITDKEAVKLLKAGQVLALECICKSIFEDLWAVNGTL